MCNFCNETFYRKVIQYARPLMAPLTHIEELQHELLNLTGEVYIAVPALFCPYCGRKLDEPQPPTNFDKITASPKALMDFMFEGFDSATQYGTVLSVVTEIMFNIPYSDCLEETEGALANIERWLDQQAESEE